MNWWIYNWSNLGRFITPDTIIPSPTNPQSWNRYSYVHNNPIAYNDPSGHILGYVMDAVSIGLGVRSLKQNIQSGNAAGAAVDALGIVVDTAAFIVPVVPSGAGYAIKAARIAKHGDKVVDAAEITVALVKDGPEQGTSMP